MFEYAARNKLREHIRSTYCVDYQEKKQIRGYVHTNLDKVCDDFQEELLYAIGEDFKTVLKQPIRPEWIGFDCPDDPSVWLYRLVQASIGKIDDDLVWSGYHIGSLDTRERNRRFAEMIEKKLIESGVTDIKLVVPEPDKNCYQIESLCTGRYLRLW